MFYMCWGDVLDCRTHPMQVFFEMMKHPNMIPIAGNHELMGITFLKFLMKEITEKNIDRINDRVV